MAVVPRGHGGLATGLGCPARRIVTHDELIGVLDEVLPGLAGREEPLLVEVAVSPDGTGQP